MPAARMQFRNNHVDTERVLQNRRGRSGRGPTGPASAGSWASGVSTLRQSHCACPHVQARDRRVGLRVQAKTVLYIAVGAFLGVYLMEVYPIFDPNTATVFTRCAPARSQVPAVRARRARSRPAHARTALGASAFDLRRMRLCMCASMHAHSMRDPRRSARAMHGACAYAPICTRAHAARQSKGR